jgi:hypothetical protein
LVVVSMLAIGAPSAFALESQTITFTSTPPSPAVVGETYTVKAEASSGLEVEYASNGSICTVSTSKLVGKVTEATATFVAKGTCTIKANQKGNGQFQPATEANQPFTVEGKTQSIGFTSTPPSPAVVGETYIVKAEASSGLEVEYASNGSICTVSAPKLVGKVTEATVTFVAKGTCTVKANQKGNGQFQMATEANQPFTVGGKPQTITFTPPASPVFAGTSEVVEATASSGGQVSFAIDLSSTGGCAVSEEKVSPTKVSEAKVAFASAGSCVIDANQAGTSGEWDAAPQLQTTVTINAAATPSPAPSGGSTPVTVPTPTPAPTPNSNFKAIAAAYTPSTGGITFTESVTNPGTFSWLFTFPNGKFGVFAASKSKCKAGFLRLKGRCRPSRVVFAKGTEVLAAAGTVSFTVKPSATAYKALKNAFKKKSGLPVTAVITFQSSLGGSPVSHTQSLIFKLTKN